MTEATSRRMLLALLVPLLVGACGGGTRPGQPSPPPEAESEIEAIYRARIDSARSQYTDADVRFMEGMIHHHAQALEMSRLAPTHASSPTIRTLAARITNSQRDEIETMQKWLRDRGLPAPEVGEHGEMVSHGGGAGAMRMPGMLSPEQMRELERARGTTFDRLFLSYMIQHHRGAVTMVHDLFGTDGAAEDPQVFKFASDVQVDQKTEIARMERMLAAIDDGGSRS